MTMVRAGFSQLMAVGAHALFVEWLDTFIRDMEYDKVFNMETSTKQMETEIQFSGLPPMPERLKMLLRSTETVFRVVRLTMLILLILWVAVLRGSFWKTTSTASSNRCLKLLRVQRSIRKKLYRGTFSILVLLRLRLLMV